MDFDGTYIIRQKEVILFWVFPNSPSKVTLSIEKRMKAIILRLYTMRAIGYNGLRYKSLKRGVKTNEKIKKMDMRRCGADSRDGVSDAGAGRCCE